MWPFENYNTFCPYLVGSYQDVSNEISSYLETGYRTFILDIPPNREELQNVRVVFQMASERALA
jgi:alkanesulfonate monooxygenase